MNISKKLSKILTVSTISFSIFSISNFSLNTSFTYLEESNDQPTIENLPTSRVTCSNPGFPILDNLNVVNVGFTSADIIFTYDRNNYTTNSIYYRIQNGEAWNIRTNLSESNINVIHVDGLIADRAWSIQLAFDVTNPNAPLGLCQVPQFSKSLFQITGTQSETYSSITVEYRWTLNASTKEVSDLFYQASTSQEPILGIDNWFEIITTPIPGSNPGLYTGVFTIDNLKSNVEYYIHVGYGVYSFPIVFDAMPMGYSFQLQSQPLEPLGPFAPIGGIGGLVGIIIGSLLFLSLIPIYIYWKLSEDEDEENN